MVAAERGGVRGEDIQLEDIQVEDVLFLADRLMGYAGSRGISSDVMIGCAVRGTRPSTTDYPRDLGDLGRCCDAFARAPRGLQRRMLPILVEFCRCIPHEAVA